MVRRFCRLGQTQRCIHSILLGQPILPGAQAQYIRIPHAGGTLFVLPPSLYNELPAPALLLLADILPTGLFVATQALSHAKLAPVLNGRAWPPKLEGYFDVEDPVDAQAKITEQDRALQLAVVGLGPVGLVRPHPLPIFDPCANDVVVQCATFALLDILSHRLNARLRGGEPDIQRTAKWFLKWWREGGGTQAPMTHGWGFDFDFRVRKPQSPEDVDGERPIEFVVDEERKWEVDGCQVRGWGWIDDKALVANPCAIASSVCSGPTVL